MIKAKGIDLEMLTVKSILRQLTRLPGARQVPVLEYALLHLRANVPAAEVEPPQIHLATAMVGAARGK